MFVFACCHAHAAQMTMSNKMSRQHLLMSGVAIVVCYYCSLVQTAVRAMMMRGVCIRAHVFGACMYIRTTMRIISHTPALEPIKANVSIKVKYHPHTQSREALLSARWSVSYSHGSATVRVQVPPCKYKSTVGSTSLSPSPLARTLPLPPTHVENPSSLFLSRNFSPSPLACQVKSGLVGGSAKVSKFGISAGD